MTVLIRVSDNSFLRCENLTASASDLQLGEICLFMACEDNRTFLFSLFRKLFLPVDFKPLSFLSLSIVNIVGRGFKSIACVSMLMVDGHGLKCITLPVSFNTFGFSSNSVTLQLLLISFANFVFDSTSFSVSTSTIISTRFSSVLLLMLFFCHNQKNQIVKRLNPFIKFWIFCCELKCISLS